MTRLPQPGADAGQWGDILNDFLTQAHNTDGSLKADSVSPAQLAPDSVQGSAIADASVTAAKLAPGMVTGTVTVADGAVTTTKIADNAVTNAKFETSIQTSLGKADSASQPGHTHPISDVSNLQTTLDSKQSAGSYVTTNRKIAGHDLTADITVTTFDVGAATAAQGAKADTAVQPDSLATVATTGQYNDLTGTPTLGGAAGLNVGTTAGTVAAGDDSRITSAVQATRTVAGHALSSDVTITTTDLGAATTAQGAKADSAVQPGSLATVATTGQYNDLTSKPTLGGAAGLNVGTTAGTVAAGDDGRITAAVAATRTVAGHPLTSDVVVTTGDVGAATSAQGTLATGAVQPSQLIIPTRKIAGSTYFAVSSRSFPALIRPPEQSRGRVIIRNVGTNNVNVVVANRTVANYNSPGWTGSISVAAGKELISDGSSSDLFIGPDADGTLIKVRVYGEINF